MKDLKFLNNDKKLEAWASSVKENNFSEKEKEFNLAEMIFWLDQLIKATEK